MNKMKRIAVVLFAVMAGTLTGADRYEPTWESLSKHPIPEWFKDAKFGIYAHLGVYCVPAYGSEWYPRNMYVKSDNPNSVYQYHRRTYGDQSRFGYKDFIPMFKLENFDPAEWAELYARAGARFAGPVAEHHDGFSMWASQVNRWNAGAMGPKRDVVSELVREIRKRGLKVVTSFHHAHNFQGYYPDVQGWDISDPQYADLYGKLGPEASHVRWLAKLKEVIDAYHPDQIWFDFGLAKIPDSFKQQFAAYYYNKEAEWGKPVIVTRKGNHLPEGVGVLDIERGRMSGIGDQLWQTDDATAYNSWCWVQGLRVKPTTEMLHELIDIVSKNGVLLLDVCPKADGTISDDQQHMLLEMGRWLKVNGEAIYATRPWLFYGEGPTRMGRGGSFMRTVEYTSEDVRFTRSKDGKALYAITLGWPTAPMTLRSVSVKNTSANARVEMLGYNQPLPFTVNDDTTLTITPPSLTDDQLPCQYAYAFKLTGFDLGAHPLFLSDPRALTADRAVLDGNGLRLDERSGRPSIRRWRNARESVHWLVRITQAGQYKVLCEASAMQTGQLKLSGGSTDLVFDIPAGNRGGRPTMIDAGLIRFDKPGVYHLRLGAADPTTFKPVNLWQVQLSSGPVSP